jgi:hypothetical protein
MASKFPFPFFGQGDASYYEWFEMWVWFVDPVPVAMRAALVKMAPKLCRRDAQWPNGQLLWPSTGDQWIQQHLVAEYGTAAAKKKMAKALKALEEGSDDDDDLDDSLAMGGEEAKFNADIETWLLALHKKQPILFAARREDGEAGGTKLGAWHKASVKMYAGSVEPALVSVVPKIKKDDDLRRSPITIVSHYVGAAMKPAIRKLVLSDE